MSRPDEAPADGARSSSLSAASLSAGELLAGRFRIVGLLGAGAMGEVYEAEDSELGARVAVKLLRPAIARDETALQRFRREIHLARQVTHPNVCRIFDVFHHHRPGGRRAGDAAGLLFVTMELLRGESLADRLESQGRMSESEARPLGRQMAEALAAAHRAHVVHRDFKSGNVMLVPTAAGTRAVVTDFGLARTAEGEDASEATTLTHAGSVLGSPAYMAPEQVRGEPATPASDLFALGVVLYEMLTGRLPFAAAGAFETALKRLHESPPPPREAVPGLDPGLEALVMHCLEREPANRPDAETVAQALAEPGARLPPRRHFRRRALAVAAGLLLAAATLALFLGRSRVVPAGGQAPVAAAATARRQAVAVLGFKNLSRDPRAAYIGDALAEMLPTELAARGRLLVLPSENVDRMKRDLALAVTRTLAPDTLSRVRRASGADLVVTGAYLVVPGAAGRPEVRLDASVQDTASGETVASLKERGGEDQLLDIVGSLGERLRGALGVGNLRAAEAEAVRAARPGSAEAARLYAEGLAKLRLFDAPAALGLLEQAAAADPDNALIQSALASAWSALGYESRAADVAGRALALAGGLPAEPRRLIEARYRTMVREREAAVGVYRQLRADFPDDPEYGLGLAKAQVEAGAPDAALATVAELRRLPAPVRDDPRIDLAEAEAAGAKGDRARQRTLAARAAAKGAAGGAQLVVARARFLEGFALRQLGQLAAATAAAEEARRIWEEAGDLASSSLAWKEIGAVLVLQGDLARAGTAFDRAVALSRRVGARGAEASALNGKAIVQRRRGLLEEAGRTFEEARKVRREIGDRSGEAGVLNGLGQVLVQLGKLPEAAKTFAEAREVFVQIGDRGAEATVRLNEADVLLAGGDLPGSRRTAAEALAIYRSIGEPGGVVECEIVIARADRWAGRLAPAGAALEKVIATAATLGESEPLLNGRLELALVALDRGDPARAEALAHQVAADLGPNAAPDRKSFAAAVLAAALLAQGRNAEAKAALAAPGPHRGGDVRVDLYRALVAAKLAAGNEPGKARTALREAAETAHRTGLRPLELAARLDLAELDLATGDPTARTRLDALRREAEAAGLGLLARQATAAR